MLLKRILLLFLLIICKTAASDYFQKTPPNIPFGFRLGYAWHVMKPEDGETRTAGSSCECRNFCGMQPKCMTVSIIKLGDGRTECRTSSKKIYELKLTLREQSYTFARGISDEKDYFVGSEGEIYKFFSGEFHFSDAKLKCERILKNGRLAMPKTKTQLGDMEKIINNIEPQLFMIDLKKVNNQLVWGDGTKFGDSKVKDLVEINDFYGDSDYHLAKAMRGKSLYFLDLSYSDGKKYPVLCQMNPLRSVATTETSSRKSGP